MLDLLFLITIIVVLIINACFVLIPIGNEYSTVRRVPWITFGIMALNVLVYYVSLPSTAPEDRAVERTAKEVRFLLNNNRPILADDKLRDDLFKSGFIPKEEKDDIEGQLERDSTKREYTAWLRTSDAIQIREQFEVRLNEYREAVEANTHFKFGLAPNGNWRLYQVFTYAFLHSSTLHLFGNMVFFFAVAFSLEDLYGRPLFLGFYLLAGAAACLPFLFSPAAAPLIGASGAIFGTMGAFLVRLYTTKIKLAWVAIGLAVPLMIFGKKPFGIIKVPAYFCLLYFFTNEILFWWWIQKSGQVSGIAHSVHIAGFLFGAGFAFLIKYLKVEERFVNPRIEAKVSFAAALAVNEALEILDKGDIAVAESKIKIHLAKNQNDANAIMALIQVYQRKLDYEKLNQTYGQLIKLHLANNDTEAALYAYDGLLSSYPDGEETKVRLPLRDWMILCDYLHESGMDKEAAVEYERLANAYGRDPAALRAYQQGGECAMSVLDDERALKLLEGAKALKPTGPLASRIEGNLQKVQSRLRHRPSWSRETTKLTPPEIARRQA
ncbi:MAG: hypothetical protein DMF61_02605 [Blastocatellia bacterium AA13]|nr:MAG: hypothetical protein DMF61_02605 [Blastocatellia bacterium AA13]